MFVTNGTPDTSSNRMYEDACELQPLLNEEMVKGFKVAVQNTYDFRDLSYIIRYLKWINGANEGLGLVGSRGYVYQVDKMLNLLTQLQLLRSTGERFPFSWNLLPRTGGFRSVVMHCFGE